MLHLSLGITLYCTVLTALLGACMGSFLNCLAWRTVHGESILWGRSHCDVCGHVLGARDLVPVLSFLLSGGKCRYCGAKLSRRHLLAEVLSAGVFVTLLFQYDISLQTLEAGLLACILLAASFADLEGYIIPDRFIMAGILLFLVSLLWHPDPLGRLLSGAVGGFSVAGALLLLVLWMEKRLGREAMGGGDLKLLFVTGLFFGWKKNLFCLVLACILGIFAGALGKKGKPIPWGPAIALAAWITAFAGDPFIHWYLSLL